MAQTEEILVVLKTHMDGSLNKEPMLVIIPADLSDEKIQKIMMDKFGAQPDSSFIGSFRYFNKESFERFEVKKVTILAFLLSEMAA